ncbi:hypothetical protein B5K05_16240 [Rhizobium phaseoli]|nr:hypothetical protein B5K04_16205 [Rhizobium phaseoli]RDJ12072.1 hypothetical protein B5K05_16240 [Rhizobium phaseoli]
MPVTGIQPWRVCAVNDSLPRTKSPAPKDLGALDPCDIARAKPEATGTRVGRRQLRQIKYFCEEVPFVHELHPLSIPFHRMHFRCHSRWRDDITRSAIIPSNPFGLSAAASRSCVNGCSPSIGGRGSHSSQMQR